MLPLLRLLSDGEEHTMSFVYAALANEFNLSPEDKAELLPSRQQAVYQNRIGWARTYLGKAGLLESPVKGKIRISGRGRELLASGIEHIDNNVLDQYEEFRQFRSNRTGEAEIVSPIPEAAEERTPDELIQEAFEQLRQGLVSDLLERVKMGSPIFFERLVVKLLVAMGYGGSERDAGQVLGGSGDGGIDGVIKQDRLGLDNIYIQAKRWQSPVGSPEVRNFIGSLSLAKASRGVLLTTSFFSEAALSAARQDGRIVLIDGVTLANLMVEYGVGVSVVARYEVKKVDSDFFDE